MTDTNEKTKSPGRRTQVGTVRSISGEKTISVTVDRLVRHSRYGKYIRRRTKLAVHDPTAQAEVGDRVEVTPCRPISKTKSWRLLRVLRRTDRVDELLGQSEG